MPSVNKPGGNSFVQSQIASENVSRANEAKDQAAARQSKSVASRTGSSVNVDLSPAARDALEARTKAYEIAKGTPDIREDRVAELRAKIQSGEYKVDAEQVADGIMREALLERLANIPED